MAKADMITIMVTSYTTGNGNSNVDVDDDDDDDDGDHGDDDTGHTYILNPEKRHPASDLQGASCRS